jgi:hypothetical protein
VSAFRSRRLDHTSWAYLMLDARYEKVRVEGKVVSQAVLVVVGFTCQGRREVLVGRVCDGEAEQHWGECFRSLTHRGLSGVALVVSDAHRGIRSATQRHFQGAAWQRCRVHRKRELGNEVPWKMGELMKDLAAVFAPWERVECLRRGEETAAKWEKSCPAVASTIREGLEDCLAVLSFRAPPPQAGQHQPAGEPDEAAEEADEGGGHLPQPPELPPADRRATAGGSRGLAGGGQGVLQHGGARGGPRSGRRLSRHEPAGRGAAQAARTQRT